jgi:hypothetical protein
LTGSKERNDERNVPGVRWAGVAQLQALTLRLEPHERYMTAFHTEVAKRDRDSESIKVVFLEVSSESFSALLVFSPNESGSEEKHGGNDRGDDVNSDFALKGLNHG